LAVPCHVTVLSISIGLFRRREITIAPH